MLMAMSLKDSQQIIDEIISLMQADDSQDAPQDAVRWSKNIFRARVAKPKKSPVEKIVAVLQVVLLPGKAAFGERSASAAQERQMFFQAGDTAIDLRVREADNGFDIHGQVLGADFAGGTIKLGDSTEQISEQNEFKFSGVASGKYDLQIRNVDREIIIEALELS